jgi:hypothetical protein
VTRPAPTHIYLAVDEDTTNIRPQTPTGEPPLLVPVPEAARLLGIGLSLAWTLVNKGRDPPLTRQGHAGGLREGSPCRFSDTIVTLSPFFAARTRAKGE